MRIFLDTGVFIALFVDKDIYHEKVLEKHTSYSQKRCLFLTSTYVLDELYTRLVYDWGISMVKTKMSKLNKAINDGELRLLDVDKAVFEKAQGVFLKFAEHKLSFTDATSYVLCRDFEIDEIFTLDRGFKKIGLASSSF